MASGSVSLRLLHAFLIGVCLSFLPHSGTAQTWFERLVMPGDLIEGHAKLETECDNCHESFSQGAQSPLCLDCHKKIRRDVSTGEGFHGRSHSVSQQECRDCHTDHIGRDADIVLLDAETFDHAATDFALNGHHKTLACADCHKPDIKKRDTVGTCFDCHEHDEPHKTRLGRECENCHRATGWADISSFDHSKTDFPLKGTHETVACKACHIGEVYSDLPKTCVGCHRIQDVHNTTFSEKCETCHSPSKWAEIRFDHDTSTDFTLTGKHKTATCYDCHDNKTAAADQVATCIGCHKEDDPHKGGLGTKCETCHKTSGWLDEVAFDHEITRFPLIGLHFLVPCEECHLDATFHNTKLDCASCHTGDDIHKGGLGNTCETCHNPNGWEFWTFDHNTQTRFRLTGAHAGLVCKGCHTNQRAGPEKTPTACVSCHAAEDVHRGQFGRRCSQCHSTQSFKGARLR